MAEAEERGRMGRFSSPLGILNLIKAYERHLGLWQIRWRIGLLSCLFWTLCFAVGAKRKSLDASSTALLREHRMGAWKVEKVRGGRLRCLSLLLQQQGGALHTRRPCAIVASILACFMKPCYYFAHWQIREFQRFSRATSKCPWDVAEE